MYKLVSLDMDNTTLDNNHRISAKTRETLEKAHEKGVRIIMNTGRTHNESEKYLEYLDFVDYSVTSNGSVVYERKSDRFYRVNELNMDYVRAAQKICRKYKDSVLFLVADETRCYMEKDYAQSRGLELFNDIIGIELEAVEDRFCQDRGRLRRGMRRRPRSRGRRSLGNRRVLRRCRGIFGNGGRRSG